MIDQKLSEQNRKTQRESHVTAALFSNNGCYNERSGVYTPSKHEVALAKEFVDENEK